MPIRRAREGRLGARERWASCRSKEKKIIKLKAAVLGEGSQAASSSVQLEKGGWCQGELDC